MIILISSVKYSTYIKRKKLEYNNQLVKEIVCKLLKICIITDATIVSRRMAELLFMIAHSNCIPVSSKWKRDNIVEEKRILIVCA